MRLYALGSNGSCQLGLGHDDDLSSPSAVALPADVQAIAHIACGGNHTLLIDGPGRAYATGTNAQGQCGLGRDTSVATIFTATGLDNVLHCAATWEASFFATRDGRVLACGSGSRGELGLGADTLQVFTPTAIPDFPPDGQHVCRLGACMSHVVAVLSDGSVYGWGAGRQGQLGSPEGQVWAPRKIEVGFAATHVVCGKAFTCVYGLSRSERNICMLGPGKRDPGELVASVRAMDNGWSAVQASWSGLLFSLPSGTLLGLGRNEHGQLPPSGLPLIIGFAVGSEHTVAITSAGQVIAWGWGEHGNCGLPIERASTTWNTLHVEGRSTQVFAGCATTWMITD